MVVESVTYATFTMTAGLSKRATIKTLGKKICMTIAHLQAS